jgi:hypothetical protein
VDIVIFGEAYGFCIRINGDNNQSICSAQILYMESMYSLIMRCGCEVHGMILLQASYLYTYSLLRGVTLKHSTSAAMHSAQ